MEFNKSLLSYDEYTYKFKNKSLAIINQSGIRDHTIKWEQIKFEIRQSSLFLKISQNL